MDNILVILTTAALFLTSSCQTSPTGRKQMVFMPEDQMNEMGIQAFQQMKSKQPIERETRPNAYVKCVADALTAQLPERRAWEVVVFKDDSANAFALPGGKIGVHTGLLKVAKTPSQLAAVMGHEIGHVLAQHGNERVSEQMAAQGGLAVAGAVMAQKQGPQYQLLMAALGVGTQVGLLKFSRTHESEADVMGLDLMARAGFDPRQSVELWKNMASASGGGQPPEFMSTHPSHGTRIENLQSNMDKAMAVYNGTTNRPGCTP